MRPFLARVRVLPLEGENRNNDGNNRAGRSREPDLARAVVCRRRRHRALTVPEVPVPVKFPAKTGELDFRLSVRPDSLSGSMARTLNVKKPVIFAFAAPFSLR